MHWPAWSADGRQIYFTYSPSTVNWEPTEIYRVSAAGGPIEPVVTTARRAVFPAPTPDGRGLVYAANPSTAELGLWWQGFTNGSPARPITNAVGEYGDLAVARDGSIVATVFDVRQTLMSLSVDSASDGALRAVTDGFTGDLDPSFSPRGDTVVFSSSREGSRTLWTSGSDGGNPRPLTSGSAFDERPAFSPDGQRLAFVSDRGGTRGIWMINADGGAAHAVTRAAVLDTVSWSPDGRELVYATPVGDAPGLSVVDVTTDQVRTLSTPEPATSPVWSPAGDVIAYVEARRPSEGQPSSSQVAFVSPAGRPVHPGLAGGPNVLNGFLIWSHDGRHLAAFIDPGASPGAVWILDAAGVEPPKKAAGIRPGVRLRGATWSPDGARILVGQMERTSDIVLFQH